MGLEAALALVGALIAAGTATYGAVSSENAKADAKTQARNRARDQLRQQLKDRAINKLSGESDPLSDIYSQYQQGMKDSNNIKSNTNWGALANSLYGVGNSTAKAFDSGISNGPKYDPSAPPPEPEGTQPVKFSTAPNSQNEIEQARKAIQGLTSGAAPTGAPPAQASMPFTASVNDDPNRWQQYSRNPYQRFFS